jgi:hypothetical protein
MALPWILIIALGALMGVVGQGIRVTVGLKKASDRAAESGQKFTETIEPARLLVSLLIGALAGVMAAIMTLKPNSAVERDALLALGAAGYSGTDFIEGFMARYLPGRLQPPAGFAAAAAISAAAPVAAAVSQLAQQPAVAVAATALQRSPSPTSSTSNNPP